MNPPLLITDWLIIQATRVHTNTWGPAINILNIPITEPSVPGFMYLDNIAKGNAHTLAQPIPDRAMNDATAIGFVLNKAIPIYAITIESNDIIWTFLFPYFPASTPIGIAIIKHIRLNIAKQIEE